MTMIALIPLIALFFIAQKLYITELLKLPTEEARHALRERARSVAPELFALEEAAVVHDIRWECAIPVLSPGHFRRLAAYARTPPVVLALSLSHIV
jgi:hypothetical protein